VPSTQGTVAQFSDSSINADVDTPSGSTTAPAPSTFVVPTTTTEVLGALAAQAAQLSPVGTLVEALDSLGDSYTFVSDVTTQAGDRIFVVGSRVGDGISYNIEAGGVSLEMIVVGGESWILEDGSSQWIETGEVESSDPLGPLNMPDEVTFDPSDPTRLQATYSAATLGLPGAEAVQVEIGFDVASVSFTSDSQSIRLVTTLTRSDSLGPIVAPI